MSSKRNRDYGEIIVNSAKRILAIIFVGQAKILLGGRRGLTIGL
jgi:hypothetical protein